MSPYADVRLARPSDGGALASIYAPAVDDGAISFEEQAPDADEMRARLAVVLPETPWLVAERRGEVVGYAYATVHRARAAYRWSVDTSVYIDGAHHRRGVARHLMRVLLELLARQGFVRVHAGVTLPNPGSVGLHEALGFVPVGVYPAVGFKDGAWHDVGWWTRPLGPAPTGVPAEPRPVDDALVAEAIRAVAGRGASAR